MFNKYYCPIEHNNKFLLYIETSTCNLSNEQLFYTNESVRTVEESRKILRASIRVRILRKVTISYVFS